MIGFQLTNSEQLENNIFLHFKRLECHIKQVILKHFLLPDYGFSPIVHLSQFLTCRVPSHFYSLTIYLKSDLIVDQNFELISIQSHHGLYYSLFRMLLSESQSPKTLLIMCLATVFCGQNKNIVQFQKEMLDMVVSMDDNHIS